MTAPLDEQIGELAAHVHAATARLADLAVEFDSGGEWSSIGMRSCAHWLSISTGIDLWTAREILRVGHALRALPLLHAAFADGRLSLDKVRGLTHVATPADESIWLEVALLASGSQLSRICLAFRRSIAVDDPQRTALQGARRRVTSCWLGNDGMLALYAVLPPEEGRLVLNAIESAVVRPAAATAGDPCAEGEPDHPHGALRADALVRVCQRWLDEAAGATGSGTAGAELVVHVDLERLTGDALDGRCHLEDGPALAVAAARRIGCDARVLAVIEKDGVPVHSGRSQRIVPPRMRRLLQLRDGGCRYPGCAVPARDTEGHHVLHWADLGATELHNLVSLCRFHHHRHHDGLFEVTARGGDFIFRTVDGRAIGPPPPATFTAPPGLAWLRDTNHLAGHELTTHTAVAGDRGRRFDLDHAIIVLAGNVELAAQRRAHHGGAEQRAGP